MLQKLRDKTSGWIVTLIMGLLMIPFLFVIDSSYLGGMGANDVARVQAPPKWWTSAPAWWPASLLWEHRDISTAQFRDRFEQVRMQARQQQGENFDAQKFESTENKLQVLDQLVDEEVARLAAQRAGVVISDEAVRNTIASIPGFQNNGKFDPSLYREQLARGLPPRTPEQFQQLVRDSLQQSLIPSAIATSAFSTKTDFEHAIRLMGETRDVTLGVLPQQELDAAPVSDAEITQWYTAHPANFRQPEMVSIEYVELNGANLPAAQPVDEAALRKRYEEDKSRFVDAEQRQTSHILIAVPAGADAAAQKAAEEKANKLAAEARQPGADFAALAKANSEDPGSKDAGGDLGWVEKNVMVKAFEDAVFAAKPGEVVGPVKSEFGYHIILVHAIKGGQGKSFEEVRDQLAAEQLKGDADKAYADLSGKLVDLVMKNPTELTGAAKEMGLPVQTLGPFSRADASGIAANPAVQRVVFSDAAIQDGTVSDPIELAPNHSVLVRVTQHSAEQTLPLEKVRDQVIAAIHADRTNQAAAKQAETLVERLRKGETLDAIAPAAQLQVSPLPTLQRGMPMPSAAANKVFFAAPVPAEGKPSVGKVELATGRYAVFVVTQVTPGDVSKLPPGQADTLRAQFAGMQGEEAQRAFIDAMRKQFKVTIHEAQL
ncbi:MAG TPA: peptidyl-prolyl cis-trans isomerase [Variovorax sp.]|nr:peptidyl-prolyl cis-trans isomerase [Variovorax sp.]